MNTDLAALLHIQTSAEPQGPAAPGAAPAEPQSPAAPGGEALQRLLASLGEGASFEATVLERSGEVYRLRADNGMLFTASFAASRLPAGVSVLLTVLPAPEPGAPRALLLSGVSEPPGKSLPELLRRLGIEPGERNVRVAAAMKAFDLPVTKEGVLAGAKLASSVKGFTAEQAVLFRQLNIPPAPEAVAQFRAFTRHEALLGQKLAALLNTASALLSEPPQATGGVPAPDARPPARLRNGGFAPAPPAEQPATPKAPQPTGGVPAPAPPAEQPITPQSPQTSPQPPAPQPPPAPPPPPP
ncbi:MAG: hypothetical protein LBI44_04850, partial [Oscillospiraceae bacterium]|nr:hypothetical protein [Oscillospiraceae bacterium]